MTRRRGFPLLPVLLVLFAALAALALLQGSQPPAALPPAPTVTVSPALSPVPTGTLLRVFPDLAVRDMQAIRLQDTVNDRSFTLSRAADGTWTAPEADGTLDTEAASAIARTFALLPYARSINIVSDTDLSAYGFSETPRLLFQIVLTDGSGHVIAVGDLTADGSAYFGLVDERDEIYLLERGPVDFLSGYIQFPPLA
jgi:hypothetical protein